jgi:hypothetical protein
MWQRQNAARGTVAGKFTSLPLSVRRMLSALRLPHRSRGAMNPLHATSIVDSMVAEAEKLFRLPASRSPNDGRVGWRNGLSLGQ